MAFFLPLFSAHWLFPRAVPAMGPWNWLKVCQILLPPMAPWQVCSDSVWITILDSIYWKFLTGQVKHFQHQTKTQRWLRHTSCLIEESVSYSVNYKKKVQWGKCYNKAMEAQRGIRANQMQFSQNTMLSNPKHHQRSLTLHSYPVTVWIQSLPGNSYKGREQGS